MIHISSAVPKRELIRVIELIGDLSRCPSPSAAQGLLRRAAALLGADFAVCGNGRIENGRITINTILDSAYPAEWLELYFTEGLYRYDPVVRHHMKFSEPETWANIRKNYTDEKSRAVTEWAAAYGLRHGVSSSVYIPETGMFSLFCFASEGDVFAERQKDILAALTLHLNMAITTGPGGLPPPRPAGRPEGGTIL